MSSDIAIRVKDLGKQYRLGTVGTGTLMHDLNRTWHRLRGKEDPYLRLGDVNDRTSGSKEEMVWALRNINFEVKQGEVLGIIGKNGAGKSTLLKILSQVTGPTTGEINVRGRIASLLEVGTGFHPELTGRENIYLNGAILGMTPERIRKHFDEIVEFSGIGRYLDTPVKRYSSGMYVRLAFSVAAHLDPDILIVDEVLAVGDVEFQRKCLGKMKDVATGGKRTVLFVSHNMAAVKSLCSRGIVLTHGGITFSGEVDQAVSTYLKIGSVGGLTEYKIFEGEDAVREPEFELLSVGVKAQGRAYGEPMRTDEDLEMIVRLRKTAAAPRLDCTVQVKDNSGNYLFALSTSTSDLAGNAGQTGELEYTAHIPKNFFNPDSFYINLLIVKDEKDVSYRINDVIAFNMISKPSKIGSWMGKGITPLRPDFKWTAK